MIKFTKITRSGRCEFVLDFDQMSKEYNRKESFTTWNSDKEVRRTAFTKTKALKLIKELNSFSCYDSKEKILSLIWNADLRKLWEDNYFPEG